jgi:pimeloyl-ACP methyl ester carboxylesterase
VNSDRATIINAMGDLMQTDLREELKNIETPTLIMIAGKILVNGQRLYTQEQVQQTAATQYQNHAQKTIKVANDAKHFIMMDDPQWFFETLEAYLDAE